MCSASHKAVIKGSDGPCSLLELGVLFQAHVMVGRIPFCMAVDLRSLFTGWPLARAVLSS